LPSRDTIERTIAAACVWEFPSHLAGFLGLVIEAAPKPFWRDDYGAVVAGAARLHASGSPVHALTLKPIVGRVALLGALVTEVCPPDTVEFSARCLWEQYVAEDAHRQLTAVLSTLEAGPENLSELPGRLEAFASLLRSALNPS